MNKRLTILTIAMAMCSTAFSQIDFGRFGTNVVVEDAVRNGLWIVESKYSLKDKETGQHYGRNGLDYFGVAYSPAFSTAGGVVTLKGAANPWEADKTYEKYKSTAKYTPVLSSDSVAIRKAFGGDYGQVQAKCTFYGKDSVAYFTTDAPAGEGFALSGTIGKTSGWIVWLCLPKGSAMSSKSEVNLNAVYTTIDLGEADEPTKVTPPLGSNELLGGVFVTPVVEKVGLISIQVRGLVAKRDDGWAVVPIPGDILSAEDLGNGKANEPSEELTPVNEEKPRKKKKNKK